MLRRLCSTEVQKQIHQKPQNSKEQWQQQYRYCSKKQQKHCSGTAQPQNQMYVVNKAHSTH
jgi:hypothetical protein